MGCTSQQSWPPDDLPAGRECRDLGAASAVKAVGRRGWGTGTGTGMGMGTGTGMAMLTWPPPQGTVPRVPGCHASPLPGTTLGENDASELCTSGHSLRDPW